MRYEMLFRRQYRQVRSLIAPAQTARNDVMFFGVARQLSRLGSLNQCVVMPLVVHANLQVVTDLEYTRSVTLGSINDTLNY